MGWGICVYMCVCAHLCLYWVLYKELFGRLECSIVMKY